MANGIYAAAAGIAAQQTRIDAITNDLANSDTPGYKSERIGFEDLLYGSEGGVPVGSGSTAIDLGPSTTAGPIDASDNPLSVAISGSGYLQFRRSTGGIGLSRDGDLEIDATGSLVASTGEQLVPPVKVPIGTDPSDVAIGSDGTVSVRGRTMGKIQVVDVGVPTALQPVGSNMLAVTAASGRATPVKNPGLEQGQTEGSNVNVDEAMTDLLDAQQNYTLLSHAISTQDQLLQIANQLRS